MFFTLSRERNAFLPPAAPFYHPSEGKPPVRRPSVLPGSRGKSAAPGAFCPDSG